ncbi:hypothetical protein DMI62_16020 [Escherichia coli]|nr:hypothetical protein [Escherichia coli]
MNLGKNSILKQIKEKRQSSISSSQRNFWGIGIARFLADPAWGTINFWVPIFFVETLHFSLKEIAMFVWLRFPAGRSRLFSQWFCREVLPRSRREFN